MGLGIGVVCCGFQVDLGCMCGGADVHEACVKGVPALIQLEDRLVRCVNYGEKYE
ncbi:MAG: hypothetical protein QW613_07650 [Thermoprotei archaeon]